MDENGIYVYLQCVSGVLHPVSRKILTTARALGKERGLSVRGILFGDIFPQSLKQELENSGLTQAILYTGENFQVFRPEIQAELLKALGPPEIFLFPATPEGRILSAMMGAIFSTGVTADCTALTFREDGRLLQIRPAFSGSRLAQILTPKGVQIASLRFASPVSVPERKTELCTVPVPKKECCPASWLDRAVQQEGKQDVILALGGGIREREDIPRFRALAEKMGASLFCSRCLIDRGWMEKSRQIGLSGGCVSAKLLIALGISGSLQFQAGLQEIDHLCVVDENPNTPLMALADTPIQGDLYEIAGQLLEM